MHDAFDVLLRATIDHLEDLKHHGAKFVSVNPANVTALAKQKKWGDFDEHYAVCRQYADKLKTEASVRRIKYFVELVESALAENK